MSETEREVRDIREGGRETIAAKKREGGGEGSGQTALLSTKWFISSSTSTSSPYPHCAICLPHTLAGKGQLILSAFLADEKSLQQIKAFQQ